MDDITTTLNPNLGTEDQSLPMKYIHNHGFIRLVDYMGNDMSVVQAARVSFAQGIKDVESDTKLIRYLLKHEHTTPFEMIHVKFHVKAPIFIIRQWFRHRMFSYNEQSARYSELLSEFYMPEPDYMGLQSTSNKQGRGEAVDPDVARVIREQLLINYYDSWTTYQQLLEKGLAKELARMVLPVATYSQFYVSGNLHSFMHFMKLRSDSHAQKEIQDYSNAMMDILVELFPIVMTAWRDIIILPK